MNKRQRKKAWKKLLRMADDICSQLVDSGLLDPPLAIKWFDLAKTDDLHDMLTTTTRTILPEKTWRRMDAPMRTDPPEWMKGMMK